MAGARDDGSSYEDKAHHPNRKIVSMETYRQQKEWAARMAHPSFNGHEDDANPHGMLRPDLSNVEIKED